MSMFLSAFKKPLVVGAHGQLARAFALLVPQAEVIGSDSVNIADGAALSAFLTRYQPDVILNAAAYTAVDAAEDDMTRAIAINSAAPLMMAEYGEKTGAKLVHFSTDYVFDGSGTRPWQEDDHTSPLNAYGVSKLSGEYAVLTSAADVLLFRTSWVFDGVGKNFLTTILRHAETKETLNVVNDQIGAPTYAPHLAREALRALDGAMQEEIFPSGMYHLCNEGFVSWYDFAVALINEARAQGATLAVKEVRPISSADYITKATRPKNSRLDSSKAKTLLKTQMPAWEQGMKEAISEWMNARR